MHTHSEKIDLAWIFGSVAKGQEQKESDIDIIFVSELSLEQISKIVGPLSKTLDRELNGIFITTDDLRKNSTLKTISFEKLSKCPKSGYLETTVNLNNFLKEKT